MTATTAPLVPQTTQEALRAAADLIEQRGVNLGGWPYEGGISPEDAIYEVFPDTPLWTADDVLGHAALPTVIERGMSTQSVVSIMRGIAAELDEQDRRDAESGEYILSADEVGLLRDSLVA